VLDVGADEVVPQPVRWLWKRYLCLDALNKVKRA
jgi:hypothetical protein